MLPNDYISGAEGNAIASGMQFSVKIHDPNAGPQNQWAQWFCHGYYITGDTIVMNEAYFAMGDPTARYEEVMIPLRTGFAVVTRLRKGNANAVVNTGSNSGDSDITVNSGDTMETET